jgi:hypothetical protein
VSSDEGVVTVSGGTPMASTDFSIDTLAPNQATLTPVGPGNATVTVTVQGKQATVAVTVGGQP